MRQPQRLVGSNALRVHDWFRLAVTAGVHDRAGWCMVLGLTERRFDAMCKDDGELPTGHDLWSIHVLLSESYADQVPHVLESWDLMLQEDASIREYVLQSRLDDYEMSLMAVSYLDADRLLGDAIGAVHAFMVSPSSFTSTRPKGRKP